MTKLQQLTSAMSRGPPPRGSPYGYPSPHHTQSPQPYYPPAQQYVPHPHQHPPASPTSSGFSPRGPPPPSPMSRFGPPMPASPTAPPPAAVPKHFVMNDRPMNREWLALEEAERQCAMMQRERIARGGRMIEIDGDIHRTAVAINGIDLQVILLDDRLRDSQAQIQAMESGQLAREYPDPPPR